MPGDECNGALAAACRLARRLVGLDLQLGRAPEDVGHEERAGIGEKSDAAREYVAEGGGEASCCWRHPIDVGAERGGYGWGLARSRGGGAGSQVLT